MPSCGSHLKLSYLQDIKLFKHSGYVFWYALLSAAVLAAPAVLDEFYIGEMAFIFIYAIAGLGLMIPIGFTGLPSLGHAAFMAIGAYTHGYFLNIGWSFLISIALAGLFGCVVGALITIPLKRMTGIYFAIASLAFAIIVEEIIAHWKSVTGGLGGMAVDVPIIFGFALDSTWHFYFLCLAVLLVVLFCTINLTRSPCGRAFVAIRYS